LNKLSRIDASFRDPSGYIFKSDGKYFRVVNNNYKENLDHLESSGLYENLLEKGQVLPYRQVSDIKVDLTEDVYKIILPEQLGHISYPYEWCFSQLKDAALLTLDIQETSLQYGMSLKDSSAYNIQFHHVRKFSCKNLDVLCNSFLKNEKFLLHQHQYSFYNSL